VAMNVPETIIAMGAAGAVGGGIMGGLRGALSGALSGALFGGIAGYFGPHWNAWRVTANAAAGGRVRKCPGALFEMVHCFLWHSPRCNGGATDAQGHVGAIVAQRS
jgi:hypothetical protein